MFCYFCEKDIFDQELFVLTYDSLKDCFLCRDCISLATGYSINSKKIDTRRTIIELVNGTKYWYFEGKLHREDGPAIECVNGTKEWYFKDKQHREDGPAIEWSNGDKEWYFEGKRHREDGPAVELASGHKEWWLNDRSYSKKEWEKQKKNNDK